MKLPFRPSVKVAPRVGISAPRRATNGSGGRAHISPERKNSGGQIGVPGTGLSATHHLKSLSTKGRTASFFIGTMALLGACLGLYFVFH